MTILQSPSELSDHVIVKGLIYGQPGMGKSTLALSAPNPVMIDADLGLRRVEKRFQVPSLPLTDYKTILALFDGGELNGFETIVFDTLGKLVDRMADHLVQTDHKAKKSDGSLSLQGWGKLKGLFRDLLKKAEGKGKHLIFVAHEKEERDGDNRIMRPDVAGSSGKDILKELDFMGYMEMRGKDRTISFSPCEKFYAKNSLKLPELMTIPNTDQHPNDFISRVIIQGTIERLEADEALSKTYDEQLDQWQSRVLQVENATAAQKLLDDLLQTDFIWDAAIQVKKHLRERTKELGITYDKQQGCFVDPAPEEKQTDADRPEEASTSAQEEPALEEAQA